MLKRLSAQEKRAQELSRAVTALSKPYGMVKNAPRIIEKKVYMGAPGGRGDKGDTPIKGQDYFTEKEKEAFKLDILSRIKLPDVVNGKTPIKGVDYFTDADIQAIKRIFTHEKVDSEPIEEKQLEITDEMVKEIIQRMTRLPENDKLVVQAIRNHQSFVYKGTRYGMEEMMHGGASTSTSTSGYQAPLSGIVNGVNQTFVWATAPNVIIVDQGRAMQKTNSDLSVNWTGTTTTILTIAPTFDIYATA